MSRRLYYLTVEIIAKRLIDKDFYAHATKTVKGWRILLIHHCVVPLPSQGKANDKSKFEKFRANGSPWALPRSALKKGPPLARRSHFYWIDRLPYGIGSFFILFSQPN
jgi:hypothetical protein